MGDEQTTEMKLIARGEAAEAASMLFIESQIREQYYFMPPVLQDNIITLCRWVYAVGFTDAIATIHEIGIEEGKIEE